MGIIFAMLTVIVVFSSVILLTLPHEAAVIVIFFTFGAIIFGLPLLLYQQKFEEIESSKLTNIIYKSSDEIREYAKEKDSELYELILTTGNSDKDTVIKLIEDRALKYVNSQKFDSDMIQMKKRKLNDLFTIYDKDFEDYPNRKDIVSLINRNSNRISSIADLYKLGDYEQLLNHISIYNTELYDIVKDKEKYDILRFTKLYILDEAKAYIMSKEFLSDDNYIMKNKLNDLVSLTSIGELDTDSARQELRLSLLDIIDKERNFY